MRMERIKGWRRGQTTRHTIFFIPFILKTRNMNTIFWLFIFLTKKLFPSFSLSFSYFFSLSLSFYFMMKSSRNEKLNAMTINSCIKLKYKHIFSISFFLSLSLGLFLPSFFLSISLFLSSFLYPFFSSYSNLLLRFLFFFFLTLSSTLHDHPSGFILIFFSSLSLSLIFSFLFLSGSSSISFCNFFLCLSLFFISSFFTAS